jgi:hypothetical protein
MRNAKLAAVLLLALSGGASAAVNETDCAIVANVFKCIFAPSEAYCDTSIMCTFYEGSCQMNFTLAGKAIPWSQSSSSSERITAGNDLCRADSDCTIKNGNIFNRINADGTITPYDVNICDDDGGCGYDILKGTVDECMSSGLLNSDLEQTEPTNGTLSGAISVAPTVAAVLFYASLLVF